MCSDVKLAQSPIFVQPRHVPLAFRADEELEEQEKFTTDSDVIRFVVRSHIAEVRDCSNEGLADDPELRRRVAIQFTIGPTGDVTRSDVLESEVTGDVADCIAEAIEFWRFPKPQGGGDVVVTYPFVLEPC